LGKALGAGALWGGVNGLLFFAFLLAILSVRLLIEVTRGLTTLNLPLFIAYVGGIGSAIAFVTGMLSGVLFAGLDALIIGLVRLAFQGEKNCQEESPEGAEERLRKS
jgi:hypothetical protein